MATNYTDDLPETRTFTPRTWLSDNDDRAWAEKLYLWYIPVFFVLAGITSRTGLSVSGNWQNLFAGFLVWLPWCRAAAAVAAAGHHPLPFWKQWWFKFQLYLAVLIVFLTYFGTEYFFDTLGMRYNYPAQTWYLDLDAARPRSGDRAGTVQARAAGHVSDFGAGFSRSIMSARF